jgi:phospholipid N-methyltransferase
MRTLLLLLAAMAVSPTFISSQTTEPIEELTKDIIVDGLLCLQPNTIIKLEEDQILHIGKEIIAEVQPSCCKLTSEEIQLDDDKVCLAMPTMEKMPGSVWLSIKEWGLFLWEFVKNFRTVGAVLPSSQNLAKTMTHFLQKEVKRRASEGIKEPIYILEAGPGLGSFSSKIIEILHESEIPFIFDMVEMNQAFCKKLRKKFKETPGAQVHEEKIENWSPNYKYDFIISGLPFNLLPPSVVQRALITFEKTIKSGGKLSFFEYIHGVFLRKKEVKDFMKRHNSKSTCAFCNLPPAQVHFLIF